jgi:hypothetical protein
MVKDTWDGIIKLEFQGGGPQPKYWVTNPGVLVGVDIDGILEEEGESEYLTKSEAE